MYMLADILSIVSSSGPADMQAVILQRWRALITHQHSMKDLVKRAVRKWQGQLAATAFDDWRDRTKEARLQDQSILQAAGGNRRWAAGEHSSCLQRLLRLTSHFHEAFTKPTIQCYHSVLAEALEHKFGALASGRRHILRRWLTAMCQRRRLRQCYLAVAQSSSALATRSIWAAWRRLCASQEAKAAKMCKAVLLLRSRTVSRAFAGWRSR